MARSTLSFGMLFSYALSTARRSRGFIDGSPPPMREATVISLMSRVKILPRFASWRPLRCWMFAHLLWPAIWVSSWRCARNVRENVMVTFASRLSPVRNPCFTLGVRRKSGEGTMAKTGERKAQILQTLAAMLENPKGERITTALLAARLEVSEAALYRHFASKAQMFDGLIEFIEQTVFTLVNKIQAEEKDAMKQIESTVATLLGFAQKNPGMTRVLIGDALVNEDERLQTRVNQLVDRLEASLRQSARLAVTAGTLPADWDVNAYANAVIAFVIGRWHQFAKSGFKRMPMDGWPQQWRVFAA